MFFLFLLIVFSGSAKSFSQPFINDSSGARPVSSSHSLYFTSGYSDNLVIASSVSHKQPYYSASLNYWYKNSIYFGAASIHIPGYSPFTAFNTVSAGYMHDFGSILDINMAISGYKVPERLETRLFRSLMYGDLKLGLDWKVLYTEISASTLFDKGSSGFYEVRNSRYFQLPGCFKKKLIISLQPYAEFLFGSMLRIKLSGTTYKSVKSPAAHWGERSWEEVIPGSDPEGSQDPGSGPGAKEDAGSEDTPGSETGSDEGGNSGAGPADDTGTGGDNGGTGANDEPGSNNNTSQPGNTDNNPGQDPEYPPENNPDPGTNNPDPGTAGPDPGTNDPVTQPEKPDAGTTDPGSGSQPEDAGTNSGQEKEKPDPGTQNNPDNSTDPAANKDQKPESEPGTKGVSLADVPDPVVTGRIVDFFGLMELEFGLPVSFNAGRFTIELEPGYVKPFYDDPYIPAPEGFTFMMNIYIKLF